MNHLSAINNPFLTTHIKVLQASGGSDARLWSEEKGLQRGVKDEERTQGRVGGMIEDSFSAGMPKDLTLDDCIIDKGKHQTLGEQRDHFVKVMREMAREDRDEENGWHFYDKAGSYLMQMEEHDVDIFARDVKWSKAKQMRTIMETDLSSEELFAYVCPV